MPSRTPAPAAATAVADQPQPVRPKSAAAFEQARKLLPGGVNSPVRAYRAVGCDPIFIESASGCRVTDLDANTYIDYVLSYGPLILGHCPENVVVALSKAVARGSSFGMPTAAEVALAQLVVSAVGSIDLVRFVNSGTEATMSAIRLARAATGRPKIIKCTGCYHGHVDGLLVQAGSGATTLGHPSSPGVTQANVADTILVPYNDLEAATAAFQAHGPQLAAIILEPIAGNMGTVPPAEGYLQGLRKLCDDHQSLLIFDEVMTGFRVGYGGAQELYGIRPDLTCLGKVVGGGLPCAAYGGREDLMRQVAPDGPVYQAGTLSGNPLAMAAGIATLTVLRETDAYGKLEKAAAALAEGLTKAAKKAGVPLVVQRVGSMLTPFFTDKPVTNYADATACDTAAFATFFRGMLDHGVILPPSQFETWFLSTAHDEQAIDVTLAAAKKAFADIA